MRRIFKTTEYGSTPNSYDLFKAIALGVMVVDHLGSYFFPDEAWLRVFGRAAFPIFLFLVGYNRSYRFDARLLAGAVLLLAVSAGLGYPVLPLHILLSILVWRALLGWLDTRPHLLDDVFMLWVAMVVFYVPAMIFLEYATLGLMFALLGWYTRRGRQDRPVRLAWLFTLLFYGATQWHNFGFEFVQGAATLMIAIMLGLALMQFHLYPVPLPKDHQPPSPTWQEWLVLLLARNTLWIYVGHVILFKLLAGWLAGGIALGTIRLM